MATIYTDPTSLIATGDTGTAFAAPISLDTNALTITIAPGSGFLSNAADGVTGQALYSALKMLWKNNNTYFKFPFPMEAITPEQFEFINGWAPADDTTRKALRTCGWVERDSTGVITKTYAGIVSLGSLGAGDTPYYQQYSNVGAPVNFKFQGPVNEAVSIKIIATVPAASVTIATETLAFVNHGFIDGDKVTYTTAGTPIAGLTSGNSYYIVSSSANTFKVSATLGGAAVDLTSAGVGNHVFTKDSTTFLTLFAREYQKTYSSATLTDIGVTTLSYITYRFPLNNASDAIKVTHADGTVSSTTPYTNTSITWARDAANSYAYFNVRGAIQGSITYALSDVVMDTGNNRWYKCTTSLTTAGTPVQPSSDAGHWAAYTEGERQLGSSYYPYTVIIDADTTVAAAASGSATAAQIYEKVQYLLRQNADIDAGANGTVTGKTASSLLKFVGDTLVTSNGVFIDSINSNDTNAIEFWDATGTKRTYPFTAAGSFEFNSNLTSDASSIYSLFYTSLPGTTYKFGKTDAVLVKDAAGTPANITGAATTTPVSWSFAYDGNAQTETQWQPNTTYVQNEEFKHGTTWYRVINVAGYTSGATWDLGGVDTNGANTLALNGTTDGPSVTAVAIGLGTGQYVKATTHLLRAVGQKITLTAALERNYVNP